MYLTLIFLPLIACLTCLTMGRFLGNKGSSWITTGSLFCTLALSLTAFYEVGLSGSPCYIKIGPWIDSEAFVVDWGFLFDSITVVMLIVVTFVSSLVHLFSTSYMEADPHRSRFMSYLSLFTFFMLMLVTADNFIQMFLGWEGVGLASYLLINFWFTRLQANKSAIKAMLVNRVGDFGLALGVLAIFYTFGTVDYATVFSCASSVLGESFSFANVEVNRLNCICSLLFVGSVGKSAQIGLHTWLPDAMEGPTPVSALIHAATMVTAGVFLVIRCSPIFEYAPSVLTAVCFFGASTAFFAATTGLLQNDLKKVIAYSTCSQLGYMIFACGLSAYSVSLFHLANHAFFKALLFLSAGSVIHAMSDEQDMRKLGGLAKLLPLTYVMMVIGSLALAGFPYLSGFYSKDVILEVAYAKYSIGGNFSHWLGCISVFFTSFYSFRLLHFTFLNDTNAYKVVIGHSHEAPIRMALPLILLAFGSIFIGYLTRDMIIGLGSDFFGSAIYTLPINQSLPESEFIPTHIKLIPLFFSIFGGTLSFIILNSLGNPRYAYSLKMTHLGNKLYTYLNKKWYIDQVYNEFIVVPALNLGYNVTFKLVDRSVIEFFGPYGISHLVMASSAQVARLQSGLLYHYAFVTLTGATFFLAFISLSEYSALLLDPRLGGIFVACIVFSIYSKKLS